MTPHLLQASALRPPVVGVCRDPMLGFRPADMYTVVPGATIRELAPRTDRPLLCRLVGIEGHPDGYLLRADWNQPVLPGDIVLFEVDPPQGGDLLRTALQIGLFFAANALFPGSGFAALAGRVAVGVVGSLLLNAVLPSGAPDAVNGSQQAASPTYSTSLSGNTARLYQPIPRVCGRHRIVPPFGAQPYAVFNAAGDQLYFAPLAVGVGNHTVERALIDDTPISHFQDVDPASGYRAPGEPLTLVEANVVSAAEVGTQELSTGKPVGGFAACGPRKRATHIGVDIVLNGLGTQSGGGISDKSVTVRFDRRDIDDFGAPLSGWTLLGSETITAATTSAVRRSFKYSLGTPARVEVNAVRTDTKDEALGVLNTPVWGGLRAHLDQVATLNANVAHYEVKMRASEQLSGLTQRSISLIVKAECRTWHPDTGWGAEVHTRNGAWWALDLATSTVWGLGLPDSRIDLQAFYDLAQVADARQDRFDYVFDASIDGWEALQLIARSMRARCFRRNGVLTIVRDQAEDLPVTAFTPRNTVPGSMRVTERLLTAKTPDGYIVEYFDNRAWDWIDVECPCPGFSVTDPADPRYDASLPPMANPVRRRIPGITGSKHAEREGLYEAAVLALRTRTASCTTEMQGMLPAYMSPVRWMPELAGYGQSGDVAFWDEDTLTMGLSEPADFTAGALHLTLLRDDGSLTDPVPVAPGADPHDVVLPEAPDFGLVLDSGTRERPKYLLGPLATADELVKITKISDGGRSEAPDGSDGAQLYALEAVVDDAGVHSADAHLLPGPGEIQDPVDVAADSDTPEAVPEAPVDTSGLVVFLESEAFGVAGEHAYAEATYRLFADGHAQQVTAPDTGGTFTYPRKWAYYGTIEPAVAALYEVKFSNRPGFEAYALKATTGEPLDTWLNLGTDRALTLRIDFDIDDAATWEAYAFIEVQIRKVGETHLQAVGSFDIGLQTHSAGDGGPGSGFGGGD